ncbi:hypothetical protein WJ82_24045 [Burkholderia ubonensis]|nr:hypothetical protein WJ82_24045 [Burkholderia ubonensis]
MLIQPISPVPCHGLTGGQVSGHMLQRIQNTLLVSGLISMLTQGFSLLFGIAQHALDNSAGLLFQPFGAAGAMECGAAE